MDFQPKPKSSISISPIWNFVGLFAMRAAIYRMITGAGMICIKLRLVGLGWGTSTGVWTHTQSLYIFLFSVVDFIVHNLVFKSNLKSNKSRC